MMGDYLDGFELGHRTMEPIYTRDGHLLVNEGTIVSYELLKKLKKHEIRSIKTLNEFSRNLEEPTVPEETMEASIRVVKEVFNDVLYSEKISSQNTIPDEHLAMVQEVIQNLLDTIYASEDLLYTVTSLIETDAYTYRHSVNVSILSILTAKSMGYMENEIKEIAMGALLHDIGKAAIGPDLLNKTERLSDEEMTRMKSHPERGYQLVKNMKHVPYAVKQIIRYHHEKLDGSGYPEGMKGLQIPRYVRIVTLCDMYDAMSTTRTYRKKMPIHTTLEILMKDATYKIDPEVYRHMTMRICLFPTGLGVLLSDGQVGIISKYKHQNPTRPNVQIVDMKTTKGKIVTRELNLEIERTLFIIDTWHIQDFDANFNTIFEQDAFNDLSDSEKARFASSLA